MTPSARHTRRQLSDVGQQRLGFLGDAAAGLLGDDQPLHVLQYRVDAAFVARETLLQLRQGGPCVVGMDRGNAQCVTALEQAVQDVA